MNNNKTEINPAQAGRPGEPNVQALAQPAQSVTSQEAESGCCQQRLVLPLVSREFAIGLALESEKEMWGEMTSEDVAVTIGNLFIRKWDSEYGEKYGRIGGELTYEEVRGCLGKASKQNK